MKNWVLTLCFFAVTSSVFSMKISIEDAFKMAEKQNLAVQKEKIELENSKKDLEMAKDKTMPSFNVSSSFSTSGDQEDSFSHKLSTNYNVYDGGEKKNNISTSEKKLDIAELNVNKQLKNTKAEIVNYYSKALKYMKNLEIYKKQYEEQVKEYEKIKLKYDNKAASKSELLSIESNIIDIESNIIQAENNYVVAIENLRNIIKTSEEIDLIKPNIEITDINIESDKKKALEYNLDLREYYMNIELAEISVRNSKTEFYPDVDLSLSYNSTAKELGDSLTEWDWKAGITVSYNIFDWGTRKDNVVKQNNLLEQRKIDLEEKQDNIELELKTKYYEIVKTRQLINSQQKKLESLQENMKIDKVKYDNKSLEINDDLESQNDYWNAEVELENLYIDYYAVKYEYFNLMN